jgi:hypothetical protein
MLCNITCIYLPGVLSKLPLMMPKEKSKKNRSATEPKEIRQRSKRKSSPIQRNTTSSVPPSKQPHYALLLPLLFQLHAISDIFHNNLSLLGSGCQPGVGECIPLLPDAHCTRSTSQHFHALRARMAMCLGRGRLGVIRCTAMFKVGRRVFYIKRRVSRWV